MKNFLLLLFFNAVIFSSITAQTWECGYPVSSDVIATLNNGKLTISGTGNMHDYNDYDYYDDYAPWGYYSMTTVIISEGITSIGGSAFSGCGGLTSITIPNSVTSIGSGAFYGCSRLTSLTIPNSVTSIGSGAFYGCSGLTSITIPNSVTSIGYGAFSNCSNLTSIDIPNSVTSIGDDAFSGCKELTSLTVPDSVTYIGDYTFSDCSKLISLTIPNSVEWIGHNAFSGCSELNFINYSGQRYLYWVFYCLWFSKAHNKPNSPTAQLVERNRYFDDMTAEELKAAKQKVEEKNKYLKQFNFNQKYTLKAIDEELAAAFLGMGIDDRCDNYDFYAGLAHERVKLHLQNPITFRNNLSCFDKIVTTPDGKYKFYSFALGCQGSSVYYENYIQYKKSGRIFCKRLEEYDRYDNLWQFTDEGKTYYVSKCVIAGSVMPAPSRVSLALDVFTLSSDGEKSYYTPEDFYKNIFKVSKLYAEGDDYDIDFDPKTKTVFITGTIRNGSILSHGTWSYKIEIFDWLNN